MDADMDLRGQLQGKNPRETCFGITPRPKCRLCSWNKDATTSAVPALHLLGINRFRPVSPATELHGI